MITSAAKSVRQQRRMMVVIYALSGLLILIAALLSEMAAPIFWTLLVVSMALSLWSGSQLRSASWGLHRWQTTPDQLDEREKIRSLEAIALAYRIYAAVLFVMGLLLFTQREHHSALQMALTFGLFLIASAMNTVPTAILAWTEPDAEE